MGDHDRRAASARRTGGSDRMGRAMLAALALILAGSLAAGLGGPEAEARKRKPGTRATIVAAPLGVGSPGGWAEFDCLDGQRVVGGGVVQSGPDVLEVQDSGPVGGGGLVTGEAADGWRVRVTKTSTGQVTARGFALCSAATDAVAQVARLDVGPNDIDEAFADCPDGTRVGGGGIVTEPGTVFGSTVVMASGPLVESGVTAETDDGDVATRWYAAAWNFNNYERSFDVIALCSAKSRATIEATQFTVPAGQTGRDYAVCRGKKRAIGGGVVQSGEAQGFYVRASGPLDASGVTLETDTGDKATQWYAATENTFDDTPRTFRVFAVCE